MQAWKLTKLFLRMFILRAKPSEVPYSVNLLLFLCIVFLLTKSAVLLWFIQISNRFDTAQFIHLSYLAALTVAVIWLLLLFAILRTTLLYYNLVARFIQTASAFVAMDCLLTLLFLLWLTGLSVVQIPFQSYSLESIGILFGFVFIMYWQFMVYIHILVYSMELSILKAGVFSLFYLLLQNNLSDVLLNVVVNVTTK